MRDTVSEALALEVARNAVDKMRPGGTMLLMGATGGMSASVLGDRPDARHAELRDTLPIGRVVGPDDVAALVVDAMASTTLTGAIYDIDGGQQLLARGV